MDNRMASNWKGHRGREHKVQDPLLLTGGAGIHSDCLERNEVPQRPPTVGQELPNNLDWQVDAQLRPRNRKRGNIEKNRNKKFDSLSVPGASSLDGSRCTSSGFWPAHVVSVVDHVKKTATESEVEVKSVSDGETNLSLPTNHGARQKKVVKKSGSRPLFLPETEVPTAKMMHNKAKTFNTNQVVGKLVQIRDFIKQVSATMESLQNTTDPVALDKLERLHRIRTDLFENERRLVELLERVSSDLLQDEEHNSDVTSSCSAHASPLANVDGTSEISENSMSNVEPRTVTEESESLVRSNEFLRQVAESQEKLKALQEQKAALLSLQHQAESRLAQAKSIHEYLLSKSTDNQVNAFICEDISSSHVLQENLTSIEQRLAVLQDIYDNRDRAESMSRSVDGEARSLAEKSIADAQSQALQDKLMDIQHKKRQMDELLQELCFMREMRIQGPHVVDQNKSKSASVISKDTTTSAEQSWNEMDTVDKMRKLDEMKSWLQTLQDTVFHSESEQGAFNFRTPHNHSGEHDSSITAVDLLNSHSENVQSKLKKSEKTKTDNISREQSNECIAKFSANRTSSVSSGSVIRVGEVLDDSKQADIQEKIWRLRVAKNKLEKLQELLSTVQHTQQSSHVTDVEYAEELLNSLDDVCIASIRAPHNVSSEASAASKKQQQSKFSKPLICESQSSVHEQPVPVTSKSVVSGRGQHKSQERLSAECYLASPANLEQCRRKSNVSCQDASWEDSKLPTLNQTLLFEMQHQMALQEELRQRQWELESLMQKDAGKNYMLNQDNHSENLSASAKSEFLMVNASTGATDVTTAATWGGSSVDNGARDGMDGNDSQEEQNDRGGEEYSSDEGVEVDNSVLTTTPQLESQESKNQNAIRHLDSGVAWREFYETSAGSSLRDMDSGRTFHHVDVNKKVTKGEEEQLRKPYLKSVPVNHESSDANTLENPMLFDSRLPFHGFVPCQSGLSLANSPEVCHAQHGHLIHQQLLLGLSQCYHLLYLQQLEMQQLQQALHNSVPANAPCRPDPRRPHSFLPGIYQPHHLAACENECNPSGATAAVLLPSRHHDKSSMAGLSYSPPARPSSLQPGSQPSALQPSVTVPSDHPPDHVHMTETLNNQVPPGIRANNYWDNFRSYSRQNLLSSAISHRNKSNDCSGVQSFTLPRTGASGHNALPCIYGGNDTLLVSAAIRGKSSYDDGVVVSNDSHLQTRSSENNRFGQALPRSVQELPKDKVNKDFRGIAISQNVLKDSGNSTPNPTLFATSHQIQGHSTSADVNASPKLGWSKANVGEKERSLSDHDGVRVHSVEDSLYAEVISLVSEMNSDPIYLIQLLREMHKLNSSDAMRRALRALRDVSLSDVQNESGLSAVPAAATATATISNQPIYMKLGFSSNQRARPVFDDSSSSTEETRPYSSKTRKGIRHSSHELAASGRNARHSVDPASSCENVPVSASGLRSEFSTFPNVAQFGKLSLSNELKVDSSPTPQTSVSGFILPSIISPSSIRQENSASEGASSSAQERESETSTDAPCFGFSVRQLEKQVQCIITSVSSFVASFSRHICTSKLVSAISSHIMTLVMSLVQTFNLDGHNFQPGHFVSVIETVLSKFNGARFCECEDALFSELAEVLFKELAFLQFMQNIDGSNVKAQAQKFRGIIRTNRVPLHVKDSAQGMTACNIATRLDDNLNIACSVSPVVSQVLVSPSGSRSEATDADLVVMARRGDDDIINKLHEDFSCDIPDVCAGRSSMPAVTAASSVASAAEGAEDFVSAHGNMLLQSSATVHDRSALATAAEGQGEGRNYFDGEVELEGEGIGDTQDLAEADQSQNYMGAECVLDDVREVEGFQTWGADAGVLNVSIDCTEDDQHNDNEAMGATGIAHGFGNIEQLCGEKALPEIGLDEVPIKLRDGLASGCSRHEHAKEDSTSNTTEQHLDVKHKRTSNSDLSGKC